MVTSFTRSWDTAMQTDDLKSFNSRSFVPCLKKLPTCIGPACWSPAREDADKVGRSQVSKLMEEEKIGFMRLRETLRMYVAGMVAFEQQFCLKPNANFKDHASRQDQGVLSGEAMAARTLLWLPG